MQFSDLPVELLPAVIQFITKPHHLTQLCQVNRTFHHFAVQKLYDRVYIYSWHKAGKTKVIKLFDTLSRYPYLAGHLNRLEIRDFPKALTAVDNEILSHVLQGLKNCSNLKSCTWTRDGSLNSDVLQALQCCPNLRELEFNGHNQGNYDPRVLLGFRNLERILIIMPSSAVVSQFLPWFSYTGQTLRSFTLICKGSNLITDELLRSIAPSLPNLEHLHLTGCPKVTQDGVWAVVSASVKGLLSLGLEGAAMKFDMAYLASCCITSGSLSRLRSITLTLHSQLDMREWINAALLLISASPIERFQVYSIGVSFAAPVTEDLWHNLVLAHSSHLLRISVHRMQISLKAVQNICMQCTELQELFIVMESNSFDNLADCLSAAKKLRTVHINSPINAVDAYPFILNPDRALSIIRRCSPTLVQFGCNSKVWQVERRMLKTGDGTLLPERYLLPYGNPEIPEQFTVVRT